MDRKTKNEVRIIDERTVEVFQKKGDGTTLVDKHVYDAFLDSFPDKTLSFFTNGYVYFDTGSKKLTLHGWIASEFMPPKPDGHSVDHIDRVKTNNRLSNLRWASQTEQNSNKDVRLRELGKCPRIWPEMTGLAPCVSYVPASESKGDMFRVEIKGAATECDFKSTCDRDVPLFQKYLEVLNRVKGLELRDDRIAIIDEHLARCSEMAETRGLVARKKSAVATKSCRQVSHEGRDYSVVRFENSGGEFEIVVDSADKDLALSSNAELRIRKTGVSMPLSRAVYERAHGSVAKDHNVFRLHDNRFDLRAENLYVKPEGRASRHHAFSSDQLASISSLKRSFGAITGTEPPCDRQKKTAKCDIPEARIIVMPNGRKLLVDIGDHEVLSSLNISQDGLTPVVCLRMSNGDTFPSLKNNAELHEKVMSSVSVGTSTVPVSAFVWKYLMGGDEPPDGHHVRHVNGQLADSRRCNLECRKGNNEDPTKIPERFLSAGVSALPYRVVLRGANGKNTQLVCRLADGRDSVINNVTEENFRDKIDKAVLKHTRENPDYPAENDRMQELLNLYLNM